MSTSIYDFDTRFAPFEAFAPTAPFAPFALLAYWAGPVQWWTDACLNVCGIFSEAMLSAMVYPYAVPVDGDEKRVYGNKEYSAAA